MLPEINNMFYFSLRIHKILHCTNFAHQNLNQKNRRVLILGDSHGRNLGNLLNLKCSFSVLNIFKPNAKLCNVLQDVDSHTKDFTFNDFVFIIGGTNDLLSDDYKIKNIQQIYDMLVTKLRNTNVILPAVSNNFQSHI